MINGTCIGTRIVWKVFWESCFSKTKVLFKEIVSTMTVRD